MPASLRDYRCLWVIVPDQVQVGRAGVGLDLLDRLAAGDHTADGRVLQAPGQRPPRQGHPLGHLSPPDLVHQLQLALDFGRVVPGTPVVAGGDLGAGLVLAAEVAVGQRLAYKYPQVLVQADRQDLRTLIGESGRSPLLGLRGLEDLDRVRKERLGPSSP
jgi:hypothetical protein